MEDELDCGQGFLNPYEGSKFQAEKIVRSMSRRIPSTIFRYPGAPVRSAPPSVPRARLRGLLFDQASKNSTSSSCMALASL